MAQQTIILGTVADDGTGDTLRAGGTKINANFTELYAAIAASGSRWKDPVRAATTVNGTLASSFENGDTIDGVTLATGDRILLKNQTTGSENGIYTVNASGAPSRTADADSGTELVNAAVLVSEGTANADKLFVCTTNAPITVGSTSLTFANPFAGLGGGDLLSTNNLSDVASPLTARANLGLKTVTSQTGTAYTAVLADADTYIQFSNASAISFTIPQNSSVAFPVGTVIEIEQAGAGALTVVQGTGTTVNSRASDLTLAGQYAVAFLKKVATNTWTLNGDL
jgi:hypothetical protein